LAFGNVPLTGTDKSGKQSLKTTWNGRIQCGLDATISSIFHFHLGNKTNGTVAVP
jgi:hypothetical protein